MKILTDGIPNWLNSDGDGCLDVIKQDFDQNVDGRLGPEDTLYQYLTVADNQQ